MPNIRVMPPQDSASTTTIVRGRSYTCALGNTLDVPDFDALVLTANKWVATDSHGVGGSVARPVKPIKGMQFLDTDLGISIVYDGKVWRSKTTGAAV